MIPPDGSALLLLRLEPLHRAGLGHGLVAACARTRQSSPFPAAQARGAEICAAAASAGSDRLVAPAMQQAKQPFGTRLQLLARLTPNAGKHTANQPTRLAHPGFLCRRSRGLGEMTPRTPRVKLFGEV